MNRTVDCTTTAYFAGLRMATYHSHHASPALAFLQYVSHIPARHFKMIHYYGFLANRKRGDLLPKVHDALDMIHPNEPKNRSLQPLPTDF